MILEEQQNLPVGFLEQVIEYRAYAAARAANRVDPQGWQSSTMRTRAMEIEHALAEEELDRRHGG